MGGWSGACSVGSGSELSVQLVECVSATMREVVEGRCYRYAFLLFERPESQIERLSHVH